MTEPLWLQLAWCRDGLFVDGLDEQGQYRVVEGASIGRSSSCELRVTTTRGFLLGGRRSYTIFAYEGEWRLYHGGHVGRARVDGEELGDSLPLQVGSVIEIDIVGSISEKDFPGDSLGLRFVCARTGATT